MMLGALVDAGVELSAIQRAIDSLGLPSCRLVTRQVKKHGFRATQLSVDHEREHVHRHLRHIHEMIERSQLLKSQKELAARIFQRIAEAEAAVHGTTVEEVHFHEVGAVDSIADVVGTAVALDLLSVDRVVCSPIPTGTGFVQIAHGRCSIPAPATAELLKGIPLAASSVEAELTTPTGAAIVATVVDEFGPLPAMKIDAIGYGAGQRELDHQANLLRLMVGPMDESASAEQVWVLQTNLDDVSGELVGHCATLLAEAGALDVYNTAIQMKKNRPGVMLSVLCHAADVQRMEDILFRETTTLGVRRWPVARHKLKRKAHAVETPWGKVDGKVAWSSSCPLRFSPEYESCRSVAAERNVPLSEIYEAARQAFDPSALKEEKGKGK